jgi:hypothetical protein
MVSMLAPLTAQEIFSKAGVLSILSKETEHYETEPVDRAYVRLFAHEVEDYFRSAVAAG